jgi:uncharacterized membrane protein
MTRKWIFTILAVLGAAGAVISAEFGLTVQLGAVVAGIAAVLVYVFNEAKADRDRIKAQAGKWTDPKFVITLVSAIVAALAQEITLPVSPEIIIAVLTAIVGILFKTKPTV